jgi:hypothetical protein
MRPMFTALPAAKPSTMAMIKRSSLGIHFSRGD